MNKENREYKSSVFTDLFYEDETAEQNEIALYNALHEEQLPKETQIDRFRIENVLYMNFKNDISFGIRNKVLIFGEHQSTINYNMPLRSLLHLGRGYEQLIPVRERYHKQQIYLPTPEFYTFYNGSEPFPKEHILKLSDSFYHKDNLMLDLSVKIININSSQKHPILERCKILKEYGIFVETVRKYQKEGNEEAMKYAIEESIQAGILKEYLIRKGSQVSNMLIAEYNYELDIQVQREEAMEMGRQQGVVAEREEAVIQRIKKVKIKSKKNLPIEQIAEQLEEELDFVQKVIMAMQEKGMENEKEIYNVLVQKT